MTKATPASRWRMRSSTLSLTVLGLVAATLVACGGDDDDRPDDGNPTAIDYASLRGEIRVDGSSTVFPITEAVAEEFGKVARRVRANVAFSGTGGGFEKFCRGEIQVSNASRPIKDSEKEACAKSNIADIVELQVAIDALTVVVSPQNTWAGCMTVGELNKAFRAGGAAKWSDIRREWPSDNIKFFYPGADSGTFDYFREAIITGVDKNSTHRADGTPSEDDNVLARGVETDKNALGYFGFAYFEEAGNKLKAVQIDGAKGAGCVSPTFDNALTGKYTPLSRPLFIYTRESLLREKREVLGFVKFYLDNMEELVKEVGYINLPKDLAQEQQARIEQFVAR